MYGCMSRLTLRIDSMDRLADEPIAVNTNDAWYIAISDMWKYGDWTQATNCKCLGEQGLSEGEGEEDRTKNNVCILFNRAPRPSSRK
jgi:hypothetical protein